MSARDRIELLTRDANGAARMRWWSLSPMLENYPGWDALAVISCGGLLVRNRDTGRLAEFVGTSIKPVNERKAGAAIAALERSSDAID